MRDDIDVDAALATLSQAPMSPYAAIEHYPSVGSTNREIRRDPRPWRVVSADEQTGGRGRMDRSWSTTPGTALAVSVLVPPLPEPSWMPLATGLAVRDAIADVTGLVAHLKWPNDVLLDDGSGDPRKVCGILCEFTPEGIIVGTGINVHHDSDGLPVPTATSLRLAGAAEVSRTDLLGAYLRRLAEVYRQLTSAPADVRERYARACSTIGHRVRIDEGRRTYEARIDGIDRTGRLVGRDGLSRDIVVAAGDVVHIRPAR